MRIQDIFIITNIKNFRTFVSPLVKRLPSLALSPTTYSLQLFIYHFQQIFIAYCTKRIWSSTPSYISNLHLSSTELNKGSTHTYIHKCKHKSMHTEYHGFITQFGTDQVMYGNCWQRSKSAIYASNYFMNLACKFLICENAEQNTLIYYIYRLRYIFKKKKNV